MTAPQRLTDRKRQAIVAAAIAEFRDNGFEVTSMDKIAATAGVSKRTVLQPLSQQGRVVRRDSPPALGQQRRSARRLLCQRPPAA